VEGADVGGRKGDGAEPCGVVSQCSSSSSSWCCLLRSLIKPLSSCRRKLEEEDEEEEFFNHYKNDLKRHAHTRRVSPART
jgi:hypothetical protein